METPGDRELRRRKLATTRSQIRDFRRIYLAMFGLCCAALLLTYELAWLALAVTVVTMVLFGWMFLKNK